MNSWAEGDWAIFGPYLCHIDRSFVVPRGEEGLYFIREFIRKNKRKYRIGEPSFINGFLGFVSYDLGAKWQDVIASTHERSECAAPDTFFVYVDRVVIPYAIPTSVIPAKAGIYLDPHLHRDDSLDREQYFEKIAVIKKYLFAGDTYQVNFSRRFEIPYSGSAFELYKRVTKINPSPFQFFLETPEFAVISNSPERLFRIVIANNCHSRARGNLIETRPIKGTMPRGRTLQQDAENIARLLASSKEAAELAMIVDLERNDLGKICKAGTVEVTESRTIEKYSHVIHTVANIRGALENGRDWFDALCALHPGGSVTGCPKKRTMEIIAELEGAPRGVYCGTAGYIDLSGACDFNIMIRTLWLDKSQNPSIIKFNSGGGIVVDSDPEKEYEETCHKAQALTQAIYATSRTCVRPSSGLRSRRNGWRNGAHARVANAADLRTSEQRAASSSYK